jgi:hypothetical protein
MIYTTLNRIRAQHPCSAGWTKLLRGLGKTAADDVPLSFADILQINGSDDALWCLRAEPQHDRLWCMVAVRCARTVQHLMTDARSIAALDVAERHAHGQATDAELAAARAAARDAARAAARDAAWDAARAAARDAARAAAWDAAMKTAGEILISAVSSCHADPGCLGVRAAAAQGGEHVE